MVASSARRLSVVLLALLFTAAQAAAAAGSNRLLDLSLEELGQIEVTSVSRREERLSHAPTAVYVITREAIRRSGATSLPEALRLAPSVEVTRSGSHGWNISIRGFNSDLSNKLLVLMDGRSVYSPLFAGVFWDVQDTLIEDVERIEVIAGPGGTLWGTNAVNGVINIITRSAWDTEGGFAEIGAGNEEELIAGLRYGGRIGDDLAGRGYVKRSERDSSRTRSGAGASDGWDLDQAGFRLDWLLDVEDTLTVQGDIYDGEQSDLLRSDFTLGTLPDVDVPGTVDVAGHNLLARWQHQLQSAAELRLQAYYDHTERDIPGSFSETRDTADVEIVYHLGPLGRHDVTWGAGFRLTADDLDNTRFATFDPESRTDRTYSLFLQDRIDVYDGRVFLTLGTKLEHNDYSRFEHQPNARLAWQTTERQTLWAAVSRAVRLPARLNDDLELYAPIALPGSALPLYVNVRGTEDFAPEELIAYEVGYRVGFGAVSVDLALFFHDYDKLMTNEVVGPAMPVLGPSPYLVLPVVQGNGMRSGLRWHPGSEMAAPSVLASGVPAFPSRVRPGPPLGQRRHELTGSGRQ